MLVLSISGEISAQEKRDSVRIYFHQGKVNIDTCLLDNGNEMERFAKICSALNDSVRLIRKIQIIGGASPEGCPVRPLPHRFFSPLYHPYH